jgi:hypothetical protein
MIDKMVAKKSRKPTAVFDIPGMSGRYKNQTYGNKEKHEGELQLSHCFHGLLAFWGFSFLSFGVFGTL